MAATGARARPGGQQARESAARAAAGAARWVSLAAWQVYVTLLAGPAKLLVPEHTRDAAFQLFCDLRTNVPKDGKWAKGRLSALKPRTIPGWIALGAFALSISAAGSALLCCSLLALLCCVAIASYVMVGFAIVAGVVAGACMLFLAGFLFVASLVAGWLAACTLAGYCWLSLVIAVCKFAYTRLQWFRPSEGAEAEGPGHNAAPLDTKAPSAAADPAPTAPPTPQQSEAAVGPLAKQEPSAPPAAPASVDPKAGKESGRAAVTNAPLRSGAPRSSASKGEQGDSAQQAKLPTICDAPSQGNRIPQPVT